MRLNLILTVNALHEPDLSAGIPWVAYVHVNSLVNFIVKKSPMLLGRTSYERSSRAVDLDGEKVVLSTEPRFGLGNPKVHPVASMPAAIKQLSLLCAAKDNGKQPKDAYVVGGLATMTQAMPYCDRFFVIKTKGLSASKTGSPLVSEIYKHEKISEFESTEGARVLALKRTVASLDS